MLLKPWPIYSWFTYWRWWFSIAFCMFTRGYLTFPFSCFGCEENLADLCFYQCKSFSKTSADIHRHSSSRSFHLVKDLFEEMDQSSIISVWLYDLSTRIGCQLLRVRQVSSKPPLFLRPTIYIILFISTRLTCASLYPSSTV